MIRPDIIIPFALPPGEHAKDLVNMLSSCCTRDGLGMLLARAQSLQTQRYDDYAPQLPHEDWLYKQHRVNPLIQHRDRLSLTLPNGYWFLLNPVHLHVASNHLVLTDQRQLDLPDEHAQSLFLTAQRLASESGVELVYGDASHWFLRADHWSTLKTSTPDAACGHNIEIWSPKGAQEIAWRKLQNEIQMEWYIHPVQEQRLERGQKTINGLWLWSGTAILQDSHSAIAHNRSLRCIDFLMSPTLTSVEQLGEVFLAGDWGRWVETMQQLDQGWFKPLVFALKSQRVSQIDLILSNTNTLVHLRNNSTSLRKFWKRPGFNHLITR